MCLELVLHHFGTLWGSSLAHVDILFVHLRVKSCPWGVPRRFRKPIWNKLQKHEPPHANGSKMGPQNRKVGGMFDDLFEAFLASFWGWVFNVLGDVLGLKFCITFMLY